MHELVTGLNDSHRKEAIMKQHSGIFILGTALLVCVLLFAYVLFLFKGATAALAEAQKLPEVNEYVLEVQGTAGVHLDMLLLTKSNANANPSRELARITVPYSKAFSAAKCWAWFDTLPDNKSGKPGDRYDIVLKRNGAATSVFVGDIQQGVKTTGGLGDL
jgi:hypothetical protein